MISVPRLCTREELPELVLPLSSLVFTGTSCRGGMASRPGSGGGSGASGGGSSASLKVKVVLLGEGRVGKTSIVLRYVENKFNDKHYQTLQVRGLAA